MKLALMRSPGQNLLKKKKHIFPIWIEKVELDSDLELVIYRH